MDVNDMVIVPVCTESFPFLMGDIFTGLNILTTGRLGMKLLMYQRNIH